MHACKSVFFPMETVLHICRELDLLWGTFCSRGLCGLVAMLASSASQLVVVGGAVGADWQPRFCQCAPRAAVATEVAYHHRYDCV